MPPEGNDLGGRVRSRGIEVVVLEIRKDSVRLGFIAPKDVPIDREEVRELKERVPEYMEA